VHQRENECKNADCNGTLHAAGRDHGCHPCIRESLNVHRVITDAEPRHDAKSPALRQAAPSQLMGQQD
jgi:hypothetical protein